MSLKELNPVGAELYLQIENCTKTFIDNLNIFSSLWKCSGGGIVWTYTYEWRDIHESNWGNVYVIALVDSSDEIDLAAKQGYSAVIEISKLPENGCLHFEEAMALANRKCSLCHETGHDRRRCEQRSKTEKNSPDPWHDLEWNEHIEAMEIVEKHPNGMTLEEIGAVLEITRERVRQIEYSALEKLIVDGFGYDPSIMEQVKKDFNDDKLSQAIMIDLLDITADELSEQLNGVVTQSIDGFFFRILDCEKCEEPFIRCSGRQRYCETCQPEIRNRRKLSS